MLNHVMKQGSGTANTLGTLAVMYSAFGVLLQNIRGEDDDLNTILAGTATGFLYKSTCIHKLRPNKLEAFKVFFIYCSWTKKMCLGWRSRSRHNKSLLSFPNDEIWIK